MNSPASLARRIGAHLLDSGLVLLVAYLSTLPISFAFNYGFGDLYLAVCQSIVIGYGLLKDAWWPGQSAGKRVARIRIVRVQTGDAATRLRCVGRQTILIFAVGLIYLFAYLSVSYSPGLASQAVLSTVLSAGAPIRLVPLLPNATFSNPIIIGHLVVLAFFALELAMAYRLGGRRRIVDLLAGTQVVDDRGPHSS
jgi:uncharacterized RDD family membrane protein YckC